MAPPKNRDPTKKNRRKRKRKPVEFSSSSSSSSSSEDEQTVKPTPPVVQSSSSASSSSSSESSGSDSDSEPSSPLRRVPPPQTQTQTHAEVVATREDAETPVASRTPSPEPTAFPSFLPAKSAAAEAQEREEKEKQMKERFRQFWMATVADEFKTDLEEIRKEPGLTQSRLAMLIEGLASSANTFQSRDGDVNEMELVVDAIEIDSRSAGTSASTA
ncbi:hypothetical protein FRB90_007013 [Tulasnella sp. 427]|nr:hypothetical protein FRB90_007013 [Tulasnella sp. 427]